MMFVIKEVKGEDQKMAVVAEILRDLPEWFGIPESTQAYIEGAKDLRVWAAYQESDVVGFISLSYSSEDCAEIDCLGVKKLFQGQGIGRELILGAPQHLVTVSLKNMVSLLKMPVNFTNHCKKRKSLVSPSSFFVNVIQNLTF